MHPLSKSWALLRRKPKTNFTNKQNNYLKKKYNEAVFSVKHWKIKEVALEMEPLKENGKFYCSTSEFSTGSQIRSYFIRMKSDTTKTTK